MRQLLVNHGTVLFHSITQRRCFCVSSSLPFRTTLNLRRTNSQIDGQLCGRKIVADAGVISRVQVEERKRVSRLFSPHKTLIYWPEQEKQLQINKEPRCRRERFKLPPFCWFQCQAEDHNYLSSQTGTLGHSPNWWLVELEIHGFKYFHVDMSWWRKEFKC